MANQKELDLLLRGKTFWNTWRREYAEIHALEPDLHEADLHSADLQGFDLPNTDLDGAILIGANFDGAHLSSREIDGADFTEVPR